MARGRRDGAVASQPRWAASRRRIVEASGVASVSSRRNDSPTRGTRPDETRHIPIIVMRSRKPSGSDASTAAFDQGCMWASTTGTPARERLGTARL